jgi:hypothetical protein
MGLAHAHPPSESAQTHPAFAKEPWQLLAERRVRSLRAHSNLFALTDLASNVAVGWGLWPAGDSNYEVRALRYLLNDLFEKWPECPTTHIVADRAWDDKEAIRDCAVRFGIFLIVGRDDDGATEGGETTLFRLNPADHPDIAAYDRYGNAYCRHCRDGSGREIVLKRKTYEFFGREKRDAAGIGPGEAAREGSAFRVFYECGRADCPERRSAPRT